MAGQLEKTVRKFFDEVGVAGLVLPSGWFGGRPMENQHRLTFVAERPRRLLVELDDDLLLAFSGSVRAERASTTLAMAAGTPCLVIEDFAQLAFDWLDEGRDRPHCEIFREGRVCLVAPT
jgi:hypothetical protein